MSGNSLGRRARIFAVAALALTGVALIGVTSGAARTSAGPENIVEPTISGPAVVGERLAGSRGVWTGAGISYAYQWLQCRAEPVGDSSSATCKTITGATGTGYTVGNDDLGRRIRFRVKGTTKGGTTVATSAPTSVVQQPGTKPASTYPPVISGTAVVGETLRTTTGSWVGDQPITFSYKWLRCDKNGNACAGTGKAQATYKVAQADVGKTLRTRVIAKNSRGQGDAYSPATDVVADSGGSGGIITLPNGEKSVDVKDIPKGERLIVDKVVFSPNPLTSTTASFVAQIKVKDTRGYVVRGAIVFIRTTPRVANGGDNVPTSVEGWVQYSLPPTADMEKMRQFSNLQLFVKAYRKGDSGLAGISGTRLVQVGLNLR